jgi:hypothetical protein
LRIQKQSSGGTSFICAAKLKVKEFTERRRTKVEAFENWRFFQVSEESAQKLRRSNDSHQIG